MTDGQLCFNVFRPYFALVWKDKGKVHKLSLQVSNMHIWRASCSPAEWASNWPVDNYAKALHTTVKLICSAMAGNSFVASIFLCLLSVKCVRKLDSSDTPFPLFFSQLESVAEHDAAIPPCAALISFASHPPESRKPLGELSNVSEWQYQCMMLFASWYLPQW